MHYNNNVKQRRIEADLIIETDGLVCVYACESVCIQVSEHV